MLKLKIGLCSVTVAVSKLYASRPPNDFKPPPPQKKKLEQNARFDLRAVFTHLGSAVCVVTSYDFSVTLQH